MKKIAENLRIGALFVLLDLWWLELCMISLKGNSNIKSLVIQNWKGIKDTGAVNSTCLGRGTGCAGFYERVMSNVLLWSM